MLILLSDLILSKIDMHLGRFVSALQSIAWWTAVCDLAHTTRNSH